jgi:antitoxin (DNA-binding transcriptional repressor) of toxin-antitoxin stability system
MTQIDFAKAQECFQTLIELAAQGEEVVISKDEQPWVKIVSVVKPKKERQFGSAKGLIKMADDFMQPLEDFRDYM